MRLADPRGIPLTVAINDRTAVAERRNDTCALSRIHRSYLEIREGWLSSRGFRIATRGSRGSGRYAPAEAEMTNSALAYASRPKVARKSASREESFHSACAM